MAQGIVVKIWNVTAGKQTRSGAAQIRSSIDYIENPEKTGVKLGELPVRQVGNEISYVTDDIKTMDGLYVGTRHISDVSHAVEEMMQVKEFYGKLDGRVATHGVISLDESESDPSHAGKLMLLLDELMKQVFPENQVVYAVHTNTENLHIHFIINTVGLDGKKIHMDRKFMSRVLEPAVNALAEKYGFTPNGQWRREKQPKQIPLAQRKTILRKLVDYAVEQTDDFAAFIAYLRSEGLVVNVGKTVTLQMEGMEHAMRIGQLGENYTPDALRRRLASKLDPIVWKGIGPHAHYISQKDMLSFTPAKMKQYRDMNEQEKAHAKRLLKLGRNPWEETGKDNWQLRKMEKQLNETGYVCELVHYYSGGSDHVKDALDELIRRRKELSRERKELRENLKSYRPQTAIYEEMKKYMLHAYLYDVCGQTEYQSEFEAYSELSQRLEKIYGKTVDEVAAFVRDQKDQLLYSKAQETELKAQYKAIRAYEEKGTFRTDENVLSFFRAVGHSEARQEARDYGICTSSLKYITARGREDIVVRVVTTPDVVKGKASVVTEITVLGEKDEVLREISSKDMDAKAFNDAIFALAGEYGLKDCQVHRKNTRKIVP